MMNGINTEISELDPEFQEQFGEPVYVQSETNFANDEEDNDRIYICEYLPDPTKYAFLFDIGNGWWNFFKLVDKSEVEERDDD